MATKDYLVSLAGWTSSSRVDMQASSGRTTWDYTFSSSIWSPVSRGGVGPTMYPVVTKHDGVQQPI